MNATTMVGSRKISSFPGLFWWLMVVVILAKTGGGRQKKGADPCFCDAFQPVIPPPPLFRGNHRQRASGFLALSNGNNNNSRLVGSISSSGNTNNPKRPTGSLGIPTKTKMKDRNQQPKKAKNNKMSKKDRQRTGNGQVDSTKQAFGTDPENETIQVLEAKRGNKVVTIIRGMASPMDQRKKLLKGMKKSFGVGGTLVEGVLEIQGAYADRAVQMLQKQGYAKARKIGKQA